MQKAAFCACILCIYRASTTISSPLYYFFFFRKRRVCITHTYTHKYSENSFIYTENLNTFIHRQHKKKRKHSRFLLPSFLARTHIECKYCEISYVDWIVNRLWLEYTWRREERIWKRNAKKEDTHVRVCVSVIKSNWFGVVNNNEWQPLNGLITLWNSL